MRKRKPQELKVSGIEWIGKIPANWSVFKLGYYTYLKGRVGWHGLTTEEYQDSGPYLVTGTDFNNGEISWDSCHHISMERYEQDKYIQLQEGDLLITKDGTIGKTAIVRSLEGEATLNTGVFLVRPLDESYTTRFLYWILNSTVFNEYIEYSKTGSTVAHLYQETFANWKFPVPKIDQQTAIATFLDRKTQAIDRLIEKKQQLIEKLKEKRQALITQAVTKGLPSEAAAKAGLNPGAPMKDSGIEWLGEIPEHWEITKTKFVTNKIIDGTHHTPTYTDEGVPFLRVTDIHNEKINLDDVKRISVEEHNQLKSRCNPERGDLLLSKNGTIGITKVIDWEWEFSIFVSLCLIKFKKKKISPYYYAYFFKSDIVEQQITAGSKKTSVTNLHLDKIKELIVTLPPINEQKDIIKHLKDINYEYNVYLKKMNSSISKLKEYRQSLISAAVTGKIDVRDEVEETVIQEAL